jgi:hypothetical protein
MLEALPQRIATIIEAARPWVILDARFICFLVLVFIVVLIARAHFVFVTGVLHCDTWPLATEMPTVIDPRKQRVIGANVELPTRDEFAGDANRSDCGAVTTAFAPFAEEEG